MTAIDNIINQIEGETQNRGNTKTRVAAVLRLLRNKIADLFSTKLDKGTYSGNAGDLIGAIGNKVDKVPGKMLSTNDFTNAYKQKLDTLEDYDIELDEATTEFKLKKGNNVVRRIPLMFLDDEGTKLLYNRTAKTLELRDKRDNLLTSIPVSHFVSNIPTSIVVKNGKIKLMAGSEVINENTISYNDLADKPNLNFAPEGHRHNWDDIEGKPALATEEKIVEAVNGIKIGGRNYLKRSNQNVNNNDYNIANYSITEPIREGEIVTVSLKGNLGAGKQSFALYNSGGIVPLENLIHKGGGLYQATFAWRINISGNIAANDTLSVWTLPNSVNANSSIEWIKLERGNTPTDWTPAPEDLLLKNVSIEQNWTATEEWADRTVFVQGSCNVELNQLPHLASISFRKAFVGAAVTFTCTGKTIIYTGDNAFNGGEGSTAVVSIWNHKCYIDIRNV